MDATEQTVQIELLRDTIHLAELIRNPPYPAEKIAALKSRLDLLVRDPAVHMAEFKAGNEAGYNAGYYVLCPCDFCHSQGEMYDAKYRAEAVLNGKRLGYTEDGHAYVMPDDDPSPEEKQRYVDTVAYDL